MPTYNSLQMHKFKSFPVPLNVRALHLPVLSTKKMVNSDNKVQLHHIKLRRCAHNVRTCYAGNAGGILHLRHENEGKWNLLPEHGFQASDEVLQYSIRVKEPRPPHPLPHC